MPRAELLAKLAGVPGWFEDEEAWTLHEAIQSRSGDGPLTVVEIGSWQGRSTIVLADAVRARGVGGMVHSIDPHSGTRLHDSTGVADTHESFLANIRRAGVDDLVRSIRSESAAARHRFDDRSIDVLLIDGAHGYDDVIQAIETWTPALRDGASIAFHDAADYAEVRRAIRNRVLILRSAFRDPQLVQNTLIVGFRRSAAARLRAVVAKIRFRRTYPHQSNSSRGCPTP